MRIMAGLIVCLVLCLVGGSLAAERYVGYQYHGVYPGNCGGDGFYYMDPHYYMVCEQGAGYKLPCGPGTQNSRHKLREGDTYSYRDFCDVNMVDYDHPPSMYEPRSQGYTPMSYLGMYKGKCSSDGYYFKNAKTFMVCSNNQAYTMYCAPGSINSAYTKYVAGKLYTSRNFCDVNTLH